MCVLACVSAVLKYTIYIERKRQTDKEKYTINNLYIYVYLSMCVYLHTHTHTHIYDDDDDELMLNVLRCHLTY